MLSAGRAGCAAGTPAAGRAGALGARKRQACAGAGRAGAQAGSRQGRGRCNSPKYTLVLFGLV